MCNTHKCNRAVDVTVTTKECIDGQAKKNQTNTEIACCILGKNAIQYRDDRQNNQVMQAVSNRGCAGFLQFFIERRKATLIKC